MNSSEVPRWHHDLKEQPRHYSYNGHENLGREVKSRVTTAALGHSLTHNIPSDGSLEGLKNKS